MKNLGDVLSKRFKTDARFSLLCIPWISMALFSAFICAVNIIPSTVSSYVPLNSGDFRMEMVALNAPRQPPCIAFFGDSRVAFQIDTKLISEAGCAAANYGFPGIRFVQFAAMNKRFFSMDQRPDVIVLSTSMSLLQGDAWFKGTWPITSSLYFQALVMDHAALRFVWFGYERLRYGLRLLLGHPRDNNGWMWDDHLGRWVYETLSDRRLAELPTMQSEIVAMAETYTRKDLAPEFRELTAEMVQLLRSHADQVIILIPPIHPELDKQLDKVRPGTSDKFYNGIKTTANQISAPLIDCSKNTDCGISEIDFADPVHLNAAGAKKYSEYLSGRIKSIRSNELN